MTQNEPQLCESSSKPANEQLLNERRERRRKAWREYKQRRRAQCARGTCLTCFQRPALSGTTRCEWCLAASSEWALPKLCHSRAAHAQMLLLSRRVDSVCACTGRSLFALRKIGQTLEVDRIDSTKGYVEGNMQLLTAYLNQAKGTAKNVPRWAINSILRRLDKVVNDRFSKVPGEIRKA